MLQSESINELIVLQEIVIISQIENDFINVIFGANC